MKKIKDKLQDFWWDIEIHNSFGLYSIFAYAIALFVFQEFFAYVVLGSKLPLGKYTTLEEVVDDPMRGGRSLEEVIHYVYDAHSQTLQTYAWIIAIPLAFMYLVLMDQIITLIREKIEDRLENSSIAKIRMNHPVMAAIPVITIAIAIYMSGLAAVDAVTNNKTADLRMAVKETELLEEQAKEKEKSAAEGKEATEYSRYTEESMGDTINIMEYSSYNLPDGAVQVDARYSDYMFSDVKTYVSETDDTYTRVTSFIWDNGAEDYPENADNRIYGIAPDAEVSYESLEFDGVLTAKYETEESDHHLYVKQCYWIDKSGTLCCLEIESTSEDEIRKISNSLRGNIKSDKDPLAPF